MHKLVSGPGPIGGLLGLPLHYVAEQKLSTDSHMDTVVDTDTDTSADTDSDMDTDVDADTDTSAGTYRCRFRYGYKLPVDAWLSGCLWLSG